MCVKRRENGAITITGWNPAHARWSDVLAVAEELEQTNWVTFHAPFHRSTHLLIALWNGGIAGFLRFVVQEIGPDMDRPAVMFEGQPLTEAKVLAFGVLPTFRRQGIGRALQEALIDRAARLGCYQVRSHSSGRNEANHHLKLALASASIPPCAGAIRPASTSFCRSGNVVPGPRQVDSSLDAHPRLAGCASNCCEAGG